MNFDILMHQILQLCRFKITMKKTRKVRFKILKIIALVDEMQSSLSHERDENTSDLMRKMKIRIDATVKQISLDMKKITDVMKKMTINVNNLVNCVFMTAEAKRVSSKITSAFSAFVMSTIDFATTVDAAADAQSYVTSSFESLSFASTDRSSLNKCLYCFSKNHLYKRDCKAFNDDLISNKMHL
jgi:Asp-tRNA(Asn)/Glu-tRNA(Gln) amidotransferase C subunit